MIDVNSGKLFRIDLLHSFYADQSCPDFVVAPSAQTLKIMNGHKIITKQYNNQFFANVQTDGSGKSMTAMEEGMQLTFFLQLKNPVFFNYTNLPFTSSPGKIYYFTNRNNNNANKKNFISAAITAYKKSTMYHPGDIVSKSGTIFRAILTNKVAPPDKNSWMMVDANQYMSEADALTWLPSLSTYTFDTAQTIADIEVRGFDAENNPITSLSKTITFLNPVLSFDLDLSSLKPGKYNLKVNADTDQWIYINDELKTTGAFAVIDIFNENNLDPLFLLQDKNDFLLSPVYSIYFLNRATIWKYVLMNSYKNLGIVDAGEPSVYSFKTTASNTIVSASPIPMSEVPLTFTLTANNAGDIPVTFSSIACASPERLVSYQFAPPLEDLFGCSEIYLNY
jgi:hypothetical protein